jgi:hypothetical protein
LTSAGIAKHFQLRIKHPTDSQQQQQQQHKPELQTAINPHYL